MTRISRRQFLFLSLGFAAGSALMKVPRIGIAIGRPPETVQSRGVYGGRAYGQGAYGSARVQVRK